MVRNCGLDASGSG